MSGEFSLFCAVHNFKEIVGAIVGGKVCLEARGLAPMVAKGIIGAPFMGKGTVFNKLSHYFGRIPFHRLA